MKTSTKLLLGAVAVLTATAASAPAQLSDLYNGTYPSTLRQREALDLCAAQNPSFVRFLASDREQCYHQLRGMGVAANYSGVWSKPDRAHPHMAQD
ncbi:MAG TPA: hypothetical protein VEI03_02125 [Stellaceae bacterium]|nr:hypothetical protein [Stellaceae bacterium]